jgi:DNA-binding MarR family transcriptional regulator
MDIATNATEQKLLQALGQFKRARWHDSTIGGCKPSEIRALFCIKNGATPDAPMKVSDISKQLHVTSPTITQLLKGLEANNLVERHNDPTDRRTIGISLTEKGNAVAQRASDVFSESLHGLMNYLGEEQSEQLASLLFKVSAYFEEQAAKNAHNDYWNGEYKA